MTCEDVRKVASTSDYAKIFELFLRGWITEDHTVPVMDINLSTATKLKFTCMKGLTILNYHVVYLNVLMGYSLSISKLKIVINASLISSTYLQSIIANNQLAKIILHRIISVV
jgi:predicted DNA-binding ArsR family transcriptional regulator